MRALTIFILLAILISCKKENSSELTARTVNFDTLIFEHSMKGRELYSWKVGDNWSFAVLPGTNRGKTVDEILNNNLVVTGLDSIKTILSKMPEGEDIFWNVLTKEPFEFPANSVIDDLKSFCRQENLALHVVN